MKAIAALTILLLATGRASIVGSGSPLQPTQAPQSTVGLSARPTPTPSNAVIKLTWIHKERVEKKAQRFRPIEYRDVPMEADLIFISTCEGRFELRSPVLGEEAEWDADDNPLHGDRVNFMVKKLFDGSGDAPILTVNGESYSVETGDFVDFAGWKERGYRIKGHLDVDQLDKLKTIELRCKE
jgi:hypothetical protein